MDQDKQTLLEAAKAILCDDEHAPLSKWQRLVDNLRAAIAREEAKPADYWQTHLREAEAARERKVHGGGPRVVG